MLFMDTLVFYYELQGKYLSGEMVLRTTHIDILVKEKREIKQKEVKRKRGTIRWKRQRRDREETERQSQTD